MNRNIMAMPILYSPAQAADLLGISRSNLYNLLNAGAIGSRHIGSLRKITRADLEAYLDSLVA